MTQSHPEIQVVILAAGEGRRMRSARPKVLHPVLGRSMLEHVLSSIEGLKPKGMAVVIGHGAGQVREHIGQPRGLDWVVQEAQLGTAHAVLQCEPVCRDATDVLILCGDTPLLRTETLDAFVTQHRATNAALSLLSASLDDPYGYGRILRDEDGACLGIIEERDASDEQQKICEINSGIYCIRRDVLFALLHKVGNANAQQEYYLPDIVPLALAAGHSVEIARVDNAEEISGINDRVQLAAVEACMQRRVIRDWQLNGVTIEHPETVRIEATVRIGIDTVIQAGCYLIGSTDIGNECRIGPYAVLVDSWLDDGVDVFAFSHMHGANVGSNTMVGPFARLRPGAELDEEARIGNFVEVKKAVIGRGSKVSHLTYIGDTVMGEECNIGAGTVTCNYDGANKHQTTIGNRVFVGSDTKLVAPVNVEDDATIGAGSIITRDVRTGGLTLSARPEQRHKSNWQRPSKKPR